MIKHVWSVLCKTSRIDVDSNNISLMDVIETIELSLEGKDFDNKKTNLIPAEYEIVSTFYRDKIGTHEVLEVEVDVVDPRGDKIATFPSKVEFKEEHQRMRTRFKFTTFGLTTSGVYVYQVHTKRKNRREQVGAVPINVIIVVNGDKV